tara:strand:+ start:16237 stop:16701 length:465 start_codon:yes stop_codon:yes gene_type:complete
MMTKSWLTVARREFHATLLDNILTKSATGIPSNADKSSKPSIAIANSILEQLGPAKTAPKLPGQTAGADFEGVCARFVSLCFEHMPHLRPGTFRVAKGGAIASFDQYAHLDELEAIAKSNREIATALGSDYLIKPDIIIARTPEDDSTLKVCFL